MKALFIAFLLTTSAFASDCYVRQGELISGRVNLAKEICINEIELKLEVFGQSKALIRYTLDGVEKSQLAWLVNPQQRRDGRVLFYVKDLDFSTTGSFCTDVTEASIQAKLFINKDGSNPVMDSFVGVVSNSPDNCHSEMREIQTVPYIKI